VSGRRLIVLLLVLAAVAVPAGVLRAMCAGNSCDRTGASTSRVPFCPLPDALKQAIADGFREGRSPDVLAVTNGRAIAGGSDQANALVPWPGIGSAHTLGVPIVFRGTGVDPAAAAPDGTGLDQVAPTIAAVLGFDRPFPEVRAGVAVEGVASGERPRLVLVVALEGVGTADVADRASWPFLHSLLREGVGTKDGATGSLPLDPAATLATLGTGGLPSQHGITGTFIRNDDGAVVRAFGPDAPVTVIATLAEDLDEANAQRSKIGLVATDVADRGLVGGDWYPSHDRDAVAIAREGGEPVAVERILARGFGTDDVPDLLGVVLARGADQDERLREVVEAAERASGGSLLVAVAGTGENGIVTGPASLSADAVLAQVEDTVPGPAAVVAEAVAGGLFLDQAVLSQQHITGQVAVDALLAAEGPEGERMMADAFQGFAVSFARYC
jgi:hypothetical protein